jgi:hypothetical protein
MQFDTELLLIAMAPVFLACIGRQARHLWRTRPREPVCSSRDALCNAGLADPTSQQARAARDHSRSTHSSASTSAATDARRAEYRSSCCSSGRTFAAFAFAGCGSGIRDAYRR